MVDRQEVVLDVATSRDAALLSNLLELYLHDLSEAFPSLELGADGRFGYDKLPLYWSEPERRFSFLIRYGARVVGFVPSSTSPSSSFFVATAAPGWGAERRSFSGIVFPAGGSFAFPRGTEALFASGRASSPSTRGAPRQRSSVPAVRMPGACSPSTARPTPSPNDSRFERTSRRSLATAASVA
jgi:hypothetical protein